MIKRLVNSLRYIPVFLIMLYRYTFSPLFPLCCRFTPTCSAYAIEAFRKYGIIKGVVLTLIRLSKCHPFYPGGYDPIK